jgi:hypothetical protein
MYKTSERVGFLPNETVEWLSVVLRIRAVPGSNISP